MIEIISKIVYYCLMGVLTILGIGNFIYTKIKSKKITKALEANDRERATELEAKSNPFEELLKIIESVVPNAIKIAEISATTGEAKKDLAMAKVMLECMTRGIDFKMFEEEISNTIDSYVAMSKEVNVSGESINCTKGCEAISTEEIDGAING